MCDLEEIGLRCVFKLGIEEEGMFRVVMRFLE